MIQILFVSLGCDKNLVDSEVMLGLLEDKGYAITNEEKEACCCDQYLLLHWRCQGREY